GTFSRRISPTPRKTTALISALLKRLLTIFWDADRPGAVAISVRNSIRMSVAEFNAELICAFRGQNPACLLHLHLKEDYEEWIMLKFLAGLVCGAGVGLLIAPTSGENIRRRLAQAARDPE